MLKEQERLAELGARRKDGALPDQPQDISESDEVVDVLGTAGGLLSAADMDMSWEKVRDFSLLPT